MHAKFVVFALLAFSSRLFSLETLELSLAGRLVGGASELPGEGFLLPTEDENLTWIDSKGKLVALWSANERLAGWASVGPENTCLVPLLSGRVVALHWKPHVLRPFAQTQRDSEPSISPVLGEGGRWLLGWNDGWVSIWSPATNHKIDVFLNERARSALYDPNWGFWIRARTAFYLVRLNGNLTRWASPVDSHSGQYFLAESPLGTLWSAEPDGLIRFDPTLGKIDKVSISGGSLRGIAIGADDSPAVLTADAVIFLDRTGNIRSRLLLPAPVSAGPLLDNKGGVWVYTQRGLVYGRMDGRLLRFWPTPYGQTPPLLTKSGDLLWVASDWRLRLITHQAPPYLSWSQPGGDPQRSNFCHREASYQAQLAAWQTEASFQVLEALLKSGTRSGQERALSLLETQQKQGTLMSNWPFANVILLGIARAGVTDVNLSQGRIENDWPDLRLRAYQLLAQTSTPEDRSELMDLVRREYEEPDQNAGVLALAHSGLDPDGKLCELLVSLRRARPEDIDLAQAEVTAASEIWSVNGPDSPPALTTLVNELFNGDYPRSLRTEAEKLFQTMISAD